jgi:hypothetical protein
MTEFDKNWRTIPNRYGIGLMLALIGYFLLMRALGLGHEYFLRAFNGVILFAILYGVIQEYKQMSSPKYERFFNLFKIAMRTAFIGVAGFSVFIAFYLDLLDPVFMEELLQIENPLLSPITAAGIVFIEGFGSSFVLSYLAIQLSKKSTVDKPVNA